MKMGSWCVTRRDNCDTKLLCGELARTKPWQQIKATYADYRAVFTILEVPCISRGWLRELRLGLSTS